MLGMVVAVVATGCAAAPAGQVASDCSARIRLSGAVYTSYATATVEASRHRRAEAADCHDVGPSPAGSVFAAHPDRVRTWILEGHPPEEVLGVRYGRNAFGVFVADTVSQPERERILAELSR